MAYTETKNESNPDVRMPDARRSFLMRLLGLRRRPGKRVPVLPTLWGCALIAGFAFIVGGIAFAEYSMQPEFCRSCHIMEPYYQAWHDSTHGDVPCGDCHFEPGWQHTIKGKFEASSQAVKYITNTYGSKPHAEVRDVSCMRDGCHEHRLLEGRADWTLNAPSGRPVTIQFDHAPHLGDLRRGKTLRCVSCHSQMVQGQHIVVTLDTCYICHFKGLKHMRSEEVLGGCDSCHQAPEVELRLPTGVYSHAEYVDRGVACFNCHSDAFKGDGEVPKQMCWACHNTAQQVARYGEPNFIHETHITKNKVECSSCHVKIEHYLDAAVPVEAKTLGAGHFLENSGTCGQCHDQLHSGPSMLYGGTGGRGVPDMPSPMHRAQVDCIACHREGMALSEVAAVVGQTYAAAQASCDGCHGLRYADTLDQWKETIDKHVARVERAIELARQVADEAELPAVEMLTLRRYIADSEHNLRLVKLGRGVHNINYATALLNVAIENCEKVSGAAIDGDERSDAQGTSGQQR